jgi:microcompartment protein CcmL/EutN
MEKAVAIVELLSVARGVATADAMLKGGDISLYSACSICPGKYLIVVGGQVGAVKTALARGLEAGGEAVSDSMLLPNAHPDIFPALSSATEVKEIASLGVVETMSAPVAVEAADAAAKAAQGKLLEIRLGRGMGAKAFFSFTGDVSEVRTSAKAAERVAAEKGLLVDVVVIAKPHKDLPPFVV